MEKIKQEKELPFSVGESAGCWALHTKKLTYPVIPLLLDMINTESAGFPRYR